eukprot:snap_masked-scaffold_8-processed-gene-12.29-mRNA-1 protein AED:1.00 eAED:1.00 QI:0/0/0/0/1/1/2/0/120
MKVIVGIPRESEKNEIVFAEEVYKEDEKKCECYFKEFILFIIVGTIVLIVLFAYLAKTSLMKVVLIVLILPMMKMKQCTAKFNLWKILDFLLFYSPTRVLSKRFLNLEKQLVNHKNTTIE